VGTFVAKEICSNQSRHSTVAQKMKSLYARAIAIFVILQAPLVSLSQQAPSTAERPWEPMPNRRPDVLPRRIPQFVPDPLKVYTLPELAASRARSSLFSLAGRVPRKPSSPDSGQRWFT
jgi:hypothetical protein